MGKQWTNQLINAHCLPEAKLTPRERLKNTVTVKWNLEVNDKKISCIAIRGQLHRAA